ncbi:MAG: sugar nucleotide-binding protein [Nitrospira sp.]|nr:sugar nucleotide-binding protein [Nitrospira sp.]
MGASWEVHGLTRADLDLTDFSSVERTWDCLKPSVAIHCAALSRTKDCEQDPQKARHINVDATAYLARVSKDIPFIFLSSGEVFDGQQGWYREEDEAIPINYYGKTKLEAERLVLQNPRHTVVRIVLTAGTSQMVIGVSSRICVGRPEAVSP